MVLYTTKPQKVKKNRALDLIGQKFYIAYIYVQYMYIFADHVDSWLPEVSHVEGQIAFIDKIYITLYNIWLCLKNAFDGLTPRGFETK